MRFPSIFQETITRRVPIWNFHGDKDTAVDVSESRKMVEALKKVKANTTYTEMPGEGHGIAGKFLNDEKVQEWLFGQTGKP
ncbi:MAG: prolyl oligopeptidase family serine peptidase [Verrucomicrobiales bacterium]